MASIYSSILAGSGNTINSSDYASVISGKENIISHADYSSVNGEGLIVSGNTHCTAIGRYNHSGSTAGENVLFVIGNGTGETFRSDAFVVTTGDTSIYMNSTVYLTKPVFSTNDFTFNGNVIYTTGYRIRTSNSTTNDNSIALGSSTDVTNSSDYSAILGGVNNLISRNDYSFIGSGDSNKIDGSANSKNNFIGAGYKNYIIDNTSNPYESRLYNNVIVGGEYNTISVVYDAGNTLDSYNNFIGGGKHNTILSQGGDTALYNLRSENSIVGGYYNVIKSTNSTYLEEGDDVRYCAILGGSGNTIKDCQSSSILGGEGIEIIGNSHCVAAGKFNLSGRTSGETVLFVIGNGTDNSNRSDAMVVTSGDSSIYFNSKINMNSNIDLGSNSLYIGVENDPWSGERGRIYEDNNNLTIKGKTWNTTGYDVIIEGGENADVNIYSGSNGGTSASGNVNINTNLNNNITPGIVSITGDTYVDGDVYADNFIPFTGSHIFYDVTNNDISTGDVVCINDLDNKIISKSSYSGQTDIIGIVNSIKVTSVSGETSIPDWNTGMTCTIKKILVAAVGDNKTNLLNGFKVCDENGPIKTGTLLVTSSTPGYLMAQSDDIIRSMTVGKAMEDVTFDGNGEATEIYGFLYSG